MGATLMKDTVMESINGSRGPSMRVNGTAIRRRAKAYFGTVVVRSSLENSYKTKRMGMVFIFIRMDQDMKVTG